MPINITDEFHAATTKGKIASAKEVFLTGDTENLQQIGEKTHQLEDSIKNIVATGGASTAAAVTFDNAASGMTAVNAQGAIEELNTKNKSQDTEIAKKADSSETDKKFANLSTDINNNRFDALSILTTNTTLAYQDISTTLLKGGYIKAGTAIANVGVRVIFKNSSKAILDLETGKQGVINEDCNYVQTGNKPGEVCFIINAITNDKIVNNTITNDKIEIKTITLDKCAFSYSKNLVRGVTEGMFCKSKEGDPLAYYTNELYDATDLISVEEGESYISNVKLRFVHFFDSSKQCVRILNEINRVPFDIQKDEKFIVCTFYKDENKQYQLEKGTSITEYTPYNNIINKNYIPLNDVLSDKCIKTNHLTDEAVTKEKTDFFNGGNLFNPNASDIIVDSYMTADGNIISNESYFITGYIVVKPNTSYTFGAINGSPARYVTQFDDNKKALNIDISNAYTITTSTNTKYLRVTFLKKDISVTQVVIGNVRQPFMNYERKMDISDIAFKEYVEFFLPNDIYVAKGRTIEIYYEQICLNAHKFNIKANCQVGKALNRKFQFIGNENFVGKNYKLSIEVLNDCQDVLAHGECTVHFVSDVIAKETNILPVGDSLTNQKYWLKEVPILSNNKISFVGTRKGGQEGRSGANVKTYMDETGKSVYNFDHNYIGAGSNSEIFSESKSYSIGDYCNYNNGTSISTYVFTEHHNGPWDTSHVINLTESNPFYDWKTKRWSISAYKIRNNISYNAILIFLGTNGITLEPETNMNGAFGIKKLIDKIREEDSSTPIIVVNTIFRSSQNGIGNQGNTDGYTVQSEYKFNADKKVLLLAKALQKMIGSYPKLYISPCGFCMDSKYVFGMDKMPVNPRLTSIEEVYELYPKDSVHPQQAGYEQIADELFSTICAVFS